MDACVHIWLLQGWMDGQHKLVKWNQVWLSGHKIVIYCVRKKENLMV